MSVAGIAEMLVSHDLQTRVANAPEALYWAGTVIPLDSDIF